MSTEISYTMIKPDAFEFREKIINKIKNAGFNVLKGKTFTMTRDFAEKFYAEHQGKPFFEGLVEFMTSGPVYAMVIEKENCIQDFRKFIGNTNPAKAEKGTIRQIYGKELPFNAIHGSDAVETAQREINLVFPEKN